MSTPEYVPLSHDTHNYQPASHSVAENTTAQSLPLLIRPLRRAPPSPENSTNRDAASHISLLIPPGYPSSPRPTPVAPRGSSLLHTLMSSYVLITPSRQGALGNLSFLNRDALA